MALKFADVVPNHDDDSVDQLTKNMSHLSRVSEMTNQVVKNLTHLAYQSW